MPIDSPAVPPLSASDIERFGSDPLETFSANVASVEHRVACACACSKRERSSVRILPITKTVPSHILRYAFAAGIRSFGENKIQEALAKSKDLHDLRIDWHIVGHLQTNKAKYLTRFAQTFHALDSIRVAEAIDRRLELEDRFLDIYVQINTSGEPSKFGLRPEELPFFVERLAKFRRLRPRGLMTLAVFDSDPRKVRPCFQLLRKLRDEITQPHWLSNELCMGMSGDFELAIEEGADIVRIGQAIFGKRPTPDSHYWPGLAEEPINFSASLFSPPLK